MRVEDRVAFIWDIDGVVVDSPHEHAWRQTALRWGAKELTPEFYFQHVASKPRYVGGHAILELLGIYEKHGATDEPSRKELLARFCEEKNRMIQQLIREGKFEVFKDAVGLLLQARKRGVKQAAASASKNARPMLERVDDERLRQLGFGDLIGDIKRLYQAFEVDVCGLDIEEKAGIQRFAAERLKEKFPSLAHFVVFEDAPAGVGAAHQLGFFAVGVRRIGSREELVRAGADVVVDSLTELTLDQLLRQVSKKFSL